MFSLLLRKYKFNNHLNKQNEFEYKANRCWERYCLEREERMWKCTEKFYSGIKYHTAVSDTNYVFVLDLKNSIEFSLFYNLKLKRFVLHMRSYAISLIPADINYLFYNAFLNLLIKFTCLLCLFIIFCSKRINFLASFKMNS